MFRPSNIHGLLLVLGLLVLSSPVFSVHRYQGSGCNGSIGRNKLYIQGFVPASGEVFTSETVVPAATLACQQVNNDSRILDDYELVIEWSDTQCDASEATWQLIQIVLDDDGAEPIPRIMFLGGGCSPATEPLAALSGRFYNVTQVSYGASTPTLSDRLMFPRFFRTIPSEVQSNSARFALMDLFNWRRVALLHETRNIFSLTVKDFRAKYYLRYNTTNGASEEDDENLVPRSFTDDPEIPLKQIRDKDIRIIMAYMYEDKARQTLCQAIYQNLTSENHVWIFPAWFTYDWWNCEVVLKDKSSCSPEDMREAVRFSIFLDSYNQTNMTSETGLTTDDFFEAYKGVLDEFKESPLYDNNTGPHHYASFAYDAVWTMAKALHEADENLGDFGLSLLNFTYSNEYMITENISEQMSNPNFTGVSGKIVFDENGTRKGQNGIYQLVENKTGDSLVLELLYVQDPDSPLPEDYDLWERPPEWKGGFPPRDRRQPDTKYLNDKLIIACHVFISLAILVALGLLVFNLAMIWKPLIRDSAPVINTIIIGGCVLLLVTCYLLGVDTNTPQLDGDQPNISDAHLLEDSEKDGIPDRRNKRYATICNLRLWFFTLGFTLSFGALFAKTWQVYRVYTNPKLKKQQFKLWNFLIILGVFLVVDVVYLTIWTSWFRFRRTLSTEENNNEDTLEVYEKCDCENFNYLMGALYVYKGLLVVFGLFLAYESRNVKYYYINDSRFVSIAMYIVVIVVGIGAPLTLVLSQHLFIDPAYALAVLMVIMATMSCLLILFIPKFIYMAKGRDTMINENQREEVTAGDGLQLGHTSVDQSDMQTAEEEVRRLEEKVEQKTSELHSLEDNLNRPVVFKTHSGSDGDSGVLVTTTDEQPEVFVSETGDTSAGTGERRPSNTPTTSSASPNLNEETTDEGL